MRSDLTQWHKDKQHHSLFLHFERYLTARKAVLALVMELLFLFWGEGSYPPHPSLKAEPFLKEKVHPLTHVTGNIL